MADLVKLSHEINQFVVDLSDLKQFVLSSRRQRTMKTLYYLKSSGYLRPLGQTKYELTDLGKISVLHELAKRRQPDSKLRIIIFDIPEEFKRNRDFFRRHLISLGFRMEQRSVWCSKIPCEDLVELVINYHKLNKYTALVVGDLIKYP